MDVLNQKAKVAACSVCQAAHLRHHSRGASEFLGDNIYLAARPAEFMRDNVLVRVERTQQGARNRALQTKKKLRKYTLAQAPDHEIKIVQDRQQATSMRTRFVPSMLNIRTLRLEFVFIDEAQVAKNPDGTEDEVHPPALSSRLGTEPTQNCQCEGYDEWGEKESPLVSHFISQCTPLGH